MAFLQLEFRHPQLHCWLPAGHPLLPPAFQNISKSSSARHHVSPHCSGSNTCYSAASPVNSENVVVWDTCSSRQKAVGSRYESSANWASRLSSRSRCCCTLLPLPEAAPLIDLESLPSGVTLVFGRMSVSASPLDAAETQLQHQAPTAAGASPELSTAAEVALELPTAATADADVPTTTTAWALISEECRGESTASAALWKVDAPQEERGMHRLSSKGETALGGISPPSTLTLSDAGSLCASVSDSCETSTAVLAADFTAAAAASCPVADGDDLHTALSRRLPDSFFRDPRSGRITRNRRDSDSSRNNCSRKVSAACCSKDTGNSDSNEGSENGNDSNSAAVHCRDNSSSRASTDDDTGRGNSSCNEQEGETSAEENRSGNTGRERRVYFPSTDPLLSRRHFFITRQQRSLQGQPPQRQQQQQEHQERQLQQEGENTSFSTLGTNAANSGAVFVVAAKASHNLTEAGHSDRWGVRGLLLLNTTSAASINKDLRVRQAALPPVVRAAVSAAIAADSSDLAEGGAPLFCDTGCSRSSRSPSATFRSRRSPEPSPSSSTTSSSRDKCNSSSISAGRRRPDEYSSSSRTTRGSSSRSATPLLLGWHDLDGVERIKTGTTRTDECRMYSSEHSSNSASTSERCAGTRIPPATRTRCRQLSPGRVRGVTPAAVAEEHVQAALATQAEAAETDAPENEAAIPAAAPSNTSGNGKWETETASVRKSVFLPMEEGDRRHTAFTHFVYEPHELQDGDQLYIPIDDALLLQQQRQKSCCVFGKSRPNFGEKRSSAAVAWTAERTVNPCGAADDCSPLTLRSHTCRIPKKSSQRGNGETSSSTKNGNSNSHGEGSARNDGRSSSSGHNSHSSVTNVPGVAGTFGVPTEEDRDQKWNFSYSELSASDATTRSSSADGTGETGSTGSHSSNRHSKNNSSVDISSRSTSYCHVCGSYTPLFCFRYVFRRRRVPGAAPVLPSLCRDNASTAVPSRRPEAAALLRTAGDAETAAIFGAAAAPTAAAEATPTSIDATPTAATPAAAAASTPVPAAATTGAPASAVSGTPANEGATAIAATTRGAGTTETADQVPAARGLAAKALREEEATTTGTAAAAGGTRAAATAAGPRQRKAESVATAGEPVSRPVVRDEPCVVEEGASTPSAGTQESVCSVATVALDQHEAEGDTQSEDYPHCTSPSAAIDSSIGLQSASAASKAVPAFPDHSHEANVLGVESPVSSTSAAGSPASQNASRARAVSATSPALSAAATAAAHLSCCVGAVPADSPAVSSVSVTSSFRCSPRQCQQQFQSFTGEGYSDAALAATCRRDTRAAVAGTQTGSPRFFVAVRPCTSTVASYGSSGPAAAVFAADSSCCRTAAVSSCPSRALRCSPNPPAAASSSSLSSSPAAASSSCPSTAGAPFLSVSDGSACRIPAKAVEPYVQSRYFTQPAELPLHQQQSEPLYEQAVTAADRGCRSSGNSSITTAADPANACSSSGIYCSRVASNHDSTSGGGRKSDFGNSAEGKTDRYEDYSSRDTTGGLSVMKENSRSRTGSKTYSSRCRSNGTGSRLAYTREESDTSSGSLSSNSSTSSRPTCGSTCASGRTSGGNCVTGGQSTSNSICIEKRKPLAGAKPARDDLSVAIRSGTQQPLHIGEAEAAATAPGWPFSCEKALAAAAADSLEATAGVQQLQIELVQRSPLYRRQRSPAGQRQQERSDAVLSPAVADASERHSSRELLLQDGAAKPEDSSQAASSTSWPATAAAVLSRSAPTTDPSTTGTNTKTLLARSDAATHTSAAEAEQLQNSRHAGGTIGSSSSTGLWWRDLRRRKGPVADFSRVGTPATVSSSSSSSSTSSSYSSYRGNDSESCSASPFSIIPSPTTCRRFPHRTPQCDAARGSLAAATAAAAAPAFSCSALTGSAVATAPAATAAAAITGSRCAAAHVSSRATAAAATAQTRAEEESEAIEDIVDALEYGDGGQNPMLLSPSIVSPRPLPLLFHKKRLERSQHNPEGQHLQEQHQHSQRHERPFQRQPSAASQPSYSQERQLLRSRQQVHQSPQQRPRRDDPGFERYLSETEGFFREPVLPVTSQRQIEQPQHCLQQQQERLREPQQGHPSRQQQLPQGNTQRAEQRQDQFFASFVATNGVMSEAETAMGRQQVVAGAEADEECLAVEDILNAMTPLAEPEASRTTEQELFSLAIQQEQRQEPLVHDGEQVLPPQLLPGPQQQPRESHDDGGNAKDVKVLLVPPKEEQHVCTVGECCAICKEELAVQQEIASLPACSHFFCFPCIAKWACCVKKQQRPPCPLCKQSFSSIRRYIRRSSSGLQEAQRQQLEASHLRGPPAAGALTPDLPAERGGTRCSRLSSCGNSNSSRSGGGTRSSGSSGSRRDSKNSHSGSGARAQDVNFLFVEAIPACVDALLRHRRLKDGAEAVEGEAGGQQMVAEAEGETAAELMLLSSQTSSSSETAAGAGGCQICGQDTDWTSMLLCDGCDEGFHLYCLNPPLHCVPSGRWFCPRCCEEPPAAAAGTRRAAVAHAAADVAARAAAGRRQRELRRGHSVGSSARQRETQQQRPSGQRQRQRHQRRQPQQRQSRGMRSRRAEREMQRRRGRSKGNSEGNENRAHRRGEPSFSSGVDSLYNSTSSSTGSSAWRSLERHGWLEQFLYRLPAKSPRQASAGEEAPSAATPAVAHEGWPMAAASGPVAAAAATTAAPATAAPQAAMAMALTLSPAAERGGETCSLRRLPSGVRSSEDVIEPFTGQRRRKRRRVSSLSEGEGITGLHEAAAGGRNGRQQQQQCRSRLLFRTEQRRSSNSAGSARMRSEESSTDCNCTSGSAGLIGGGTEKLFSFLPSRRRVHGAPPQPSQLFDNQRHRAEGERHQGDRTEGERHQGDRVEGQRHPVGVTEELQGEASDGYVLDGFVVSDNDPLVPASETDSSSRSSIIRRSGSSSISEEELRFTSRNNRSDSESNSNSDCENCGPYRRQRLANSRRQGQPWSGGSTISESKSNRGSSSSSTGSATSTGHTRVQRQAPVERQRPWGPPAGSGDREIIFSSSTSEEGRSETSSYPSSSDTTAAMLSRAPLRTGLPRQRQVRSVAARALAQLQPNHNFQQRPLLAMLRSRQAQWQQQGQLSQHQLQLSSQTRQQR